MVFLTNRPMCRPRKGAPVQFNALMFIPDSAQDYFGKQRDQWGLDLYVRPGATVEQREAVLLAWYRDQLKTLIPALLEKWQPILGVQVADWGIKKMKTKWGSCNPASRRVWFNLELAKKPVQCLDYIVVHELLHLLERQHSERFSALMDAHVPTWRQIREILNRLPLGHEAWV